MTRRSSENWTKQNALETYHINKWGNDYFNIDENGNLIALPLKENGPCLSLIEVANEAKKRGLQLPLLIRFQDLLRHQVETLNKTFQETIQRYGYQNEYRGVFPIKVNQLREVVEEIEDAGAPYHFGLEVGSKPELFAALAGPKSSESLLICNGYKDDEFIRMAFLGRKLSRKVILVIEKLEELERILDLSEEMNTDPLIGIRIRLHTKGTGKWALSGGEDAKFGLSTAELLNACDILKSRGKINCLQLLHFHVGSQITDISTVESAVREATRYYGKIRKEGFPLNYLDVGGGLAIDYEGNRTLSDNSTNYTLTEYTNTIISNIIEICKEEEVPHPCVVSESGRFLVAHHSVLLVDVFGAIEKTKGELPPSSPEDHKLAHDIEHLLNRLNKRNRRESLHKALRIKEETAQRFELGLLDLKDKAKIETYFWHLIEKIAAQYHGTKNIPDEIAELSTQLGDQFLCNFSVFQSLIDHWAVGQLFPIVPIHRLNEAPTHDTTLVDITCDSDGKIDRFISGPSISETLPLHPLTGNPYILGFFLMGAYQDVMGDIHNLFGTVAEAHVFLDEKEPYGFYIEEEIQGNTIREVLSDVQYEATHLIRQLKSQIDQAIRSNQLKPNEGMKLLKEYENGMNKLTYLSLPSFSKDQISSEKKRVQGK